MYQLFGSGAMVLVFMGCICYYGDLVTTTLMEISESTYQTLWYRQPLKYRLYTMLLIQYSHKQYNVSGYGLVDCNMESYSGVSYK